MNKLSTRYRTFKRSCTGWESFASARKFEDLGNLTHREALARCEWFNRSRTPSMIKRGTKMEFESY